MSSPASQARHQPATNAWARYQQWMRTAVPLWLWHIIFLGALLVGARADIANAVYLALVLFPALVIVGIADLRAVLATWTVRACLALLVFLWLTPLWTGGIAAAHWPETALALVTVASFVVITAHLMAADPANQDRLFKVLAIVMLVIALFSALREYGSHWFTEPLVVVPWPRPDIGAAIIGMLTIGIAAGPGMNSEEWPGVRLLYWVVAVLLAVLVVMTHARAPILAVLVAALAGVLVRPRKPRDAILWGAGGLIVVGLILFFFRAALFGSAPGWTTELTQFWHLAQIRPWLGFGTQGQVLVWSGGSYVAAPANMALNALVTGGVIAVALTAALFIVMLAVGIRNGRRGLSPAPLALAVYVVVYGLFVPIDVTTASWHWLTLWLPIGIIAGAELAGRSGAA